MIVKTKGVYVMSFASAVGTKEGEGPLKNRFDYIDKDDRFGMSTWEKAESESARLALSLALSKAPMAPSEVDLLLAGDLENQCGDMEAELKKFKCAEMKAEKLKYAATFKGAFDDDEYEIIACQIDADETVDCFKAFVDAKLTEKAKKQFACKDETIENRIMVNSLDGVIRRYDKDVDNINKIQTLDDVLALLGD